jgi:hypothetical protein
MDIECILHVPGRMVPGHVQCLKIIKVQFYFRPLLYGKTQRNKDCYNFFENFCYRVQTPERLPASGDCDINTLIAKGTVELRRFIFFFLVCQQFFYEEFCPSDLILAVRIPFLPKYLTLRSCTSLRL